MEDVQDSVLCPGSTPGTPITGVFVAVVHRSVTNNNNFKKSLFNLVCIGHQCVVQEPQQCGPSLPGGLYLRNGETNETG